MPDPITWRNVVGPSLADASRPLQAAGNSFDAGFDVLGKALASRQQANQVQVNLAREGAKQSFLDLVQSAKTPEELAALQASGALDQRLATLDVRDRAAVRGADETRLSAVRNLVTQGQQFGDTQLDRQQAPIRDQIASRIASGDFAGAKTALDQQDLRNEAALYASLTEGERSAFDFKAKQNEEAQKEKLRPLDVEGRKLGNAAAGVNLSTAKLALTSAKQAAEDAKADRDFNRQLAGASQEYITQQTGLRQSYGTLAKTLNIPLDATGGPDLDRATPQQVVALNELGKRNNLPGTDKVFYSDTLNASNFAKQLAAEGVAPEVIQRNQARLVSAFDTSRIGTATGNEAAKIRNDAAEAAVIAQEKSASNRFAVGSPNANIAYEEIAKTVDGLFKGTNFEEDLPDVQALIGKLGREGIKTGSGVSIIPSQADVLEAVRSQLGRSNLTNAKRSRQIKEYLEEQYKSVNVDESIKESLQNQKVLRRLAKEKLLSGK